MNIGAGHTSDRAIRPGRAEKSPCSDGPLAEVGIREVRGIGLLLPIRSTN